MKKVINTMLILAFIVSIIMHFFPFAIWDDTTLSLLRFLSAFSIQLLLCRTVKNNWIRLIPTSLSIIFGCRSTWLFLTSPSWHSATLTNLVTHHLILGIGCGIAWLVFILGVKNKRP